MSKADCEIVDSVAAGKEFKYCRTHKVEASECAPDYSGEITLEPGEMLMPRAVHTEPHFKPYPDALDAAGYPAVLRLDPRITAAKNS